MNIFRYAWQLQRAYFDTLGEKLLGTVVLFVLLAAIGEAIRRAGRPLKRRYSTRLTEATQAGAVAVLTVGVVLALAVIWEVTGRLGTLVYPLLSVKPWIIVRGLVSVALVVVAYLLIRLLNRSIDRLSEEHDAITDHQSEVAYHVADVGVFVFAFLGVLVTWGIDPGRLFVGAGVLGAVLGFAARDTLGAITSGFVLLFSRPFRVGDWIEVEEYEGVVRDVTIVNTKIRSFDDEHVLIPNDEITSNPLVNRSRNDRLRIDIEVSVDYDTDLDRAMAVAANAMDECDDRVREIPSPRAVLKRFADSGIVLELRFWVDDPSARRVWEAKTVVIRTVKETFDREGIVIPFPQRTLNARDESGFGVAGRGATERGGSGERARGSTTAADGGED
ncbi:mechanosensitive ion channel family protein [Halococcus agarilyticus]|uniref:mechanosensitive ion channel family protein n=1 Tax=Halococcus agarilyticus TaxID=1232219 RepID=UPI000677F56F|nr:mechanosensitive ion channel family protein [Halococcus agarilyticus]